MKLKILLVISMVALVSNNVAADGRATYKETCSMCHQDGNLGAPKFGNKAAWANRINKGIDALLASAISGKGAMPPRGTCSWCSDTDLRAAIEYMTSKSM